MSSIVKAVAQFDEDLARIVPVEATEGDAVVEFDAAVGDVHSVDGGGEAFAKIFAKRQIECGVLR